MSQAPNSENKPAQAPAATTETIASEPLETSKKADSADGNTKPNTTKPAQSQQDTVKTAKNLASAALVIAIVGLGVGAWGLSKANKLGNFESTQAAIDESLLKVEQLNNQLAEQKQDTLQRFSALPKPESLDKERQVLAHLQADQQKLNERVELALGSSRQDWRLAEAEHLLRMASLRLSALQDVSSARVLMDGADQILYSQNDPAAFAAREALAKNITQLDSLAKLDRTGLFVRLGGLRDQAKSLVSALPEFQADPHQAVAKKPSRWDEWQDEISKYVKISTDTGEVLKPLLAGKSLTEVRLALSLALEQAQWAALNGETEIYQKALQQTASIINEFFSAEDQPAQALRTQVEELSKQPVNQQMPDLSVAINTLQTYIQQRAQPQAAETQEAN